MQLNPLQPGLVRGRMIHHLIEDNDTVPGGKHTRGYREQHRTHERESGKEFSMGHLDTISEKTTYDDPHRWVPESY